MKFPAKLDIIIESTSILTTVSLDNNTCLMDTIQPIYKTQAIILVLLDPIITTALVDSSCLMENLR